MPRMPIAGNQSLAIEVNGSRAHITRALAAFRPPGRLAERSDQHGYCDLQGWRGDKRASGIVERHLLLP